MIRLWSLSRHRYLSAEGVLSTIYGHFMLGHGILKYFHLILDKKVPPEDKELYSINLGHHQRFAREGYS